MNKCLLNHTQENQELVLHRRIRITLRVKLSVDIDYVIQYELAQPFSKRSKHLLIKTVLGQTKVLHFG